MKAQLCRSSGDAARGTVHDIGQEAAPRRIVGQRTHQTVGFVLSTDGMHQLWATVGEPCWGGSDGSPASIAVRFLFYFVEESPHPGIPVAWVKCCVRVGQQLRPVFLRDGLHLLQGAWPSIGCHAEEDGEQSHDGFFFHIHILFYCSLISAEPVVFPDPVFSWTA